MNALPVLPIAIPLLGAGVLAALRKWVPRAALDTIGIAVAAADLFLCARLLLRANQHTIVYWFGNWHPRGQMVIGIDFVIDPVSAALACLASLLVLLSMIFSWHFLEAGANHFHPLMLVFLAGMLGFSLTGDLFNLFVFFELMSIAAFALCGLKSREPSPLQGAFNFAITNTVAAFMVLTGIAFLYAITGALNMAQIGSQVAKRHDPLVLFACALVTCGFLIKAAIVPFHLWLPDAHAVAPTPVCALFSGIMVELGLYAVMRIHVAIFQGALAGNANRFRGILFGLGAITVVVGGIMCYAEHHLKRMLAFSTITHTGLMLTAIAIGGPIAYAGMMIYLLAHALVKAGLFFSAGILLHRLSSISEPALFGRARSLRFSGLLWFLGALGLAGMPPFSTMLGESLTSHASELYGRSWISWVFIFGGALTAAAVFRVGMHTFLGWGEEVITDRAAELGELPETHEEHKIIPGFLFAPAAFCVLGSLALTFVPHLQDEALAAATRLSSQSGYIATVYARTAPSVPIPAKPSSTSSAAIHGVIATFLALLLACTSVFRKKIPRMLRLGAHMEGPLFGFRGLQSGHPGDYVMWITVGIAVIGGAFTVLLR
jgi:multicomponent Na+:H+ antiporter subunit D